MSLFIANTAVMLSILGFTAVVMLSCAMYMLTRYKKAMPGRVLVVYGNLGGGKSSKVVVSGGHLVYPVIQDFAYLDTTPLTVPVELRTPTIDHVPVAVKLQCTVRIDETDSELVARAAERLLGLSREKIVSQVEPIIASAVRKIVGRERIDGLKGRTETLIEAVVRDAAERLAELGLLVEGAEMESMEVAG